MKKVPVIFALVLLTASVSFAQSSKATAAINTAVGCAVAAGSTLGDTFPQSCHDIFTGASVPVDTYNFATIMTATIHVSNSQSLFVSPSLVTGLYTQTKVKTSPGGTSTATGEGGVFLRAIVTNQATGAVQIGYPVASCTSDILGCQLVGSDFGVTLDTRTQTLTQSISDCLVSTGGTCTFDLTTDLRRL